MQEIIAAAPVLTDHLDAESQAHFATVCSVLDELKIAYRVNPRLVRGLDYYSRTVFEWTTTALGSQDAVCSGGRYDGLIEQLGGDATPAIGFAMGVERLVALMKIAGTASETHAPQVFLVAGGEAAQRRSLAVAEQLRDALPSLRLETHLGGGNFKAQFRRADRSGAQLAVILGDQELQRGVASIKQLRAADEGAAAQQEVPLAELAQAVQQQLAAGKF
jgi:histidyl-tRNA synthetase